MNVKVIVAVVVVLALLGVGGYVYMQKAPANTTGTDQVAQTTNETSNPSVVQSLKDVLTSKVSMKCTFSTETEQGKTSGTVFTSEGKYKANLETTVAGKTSQMYMISDGGFSYVWGSDLPTGIKMKIDPADVQTGDTDSETSKYFDPNLKADYSCQPTVVTAADFAVPTDVKFMDLSATLEDSQKMLEQFEDAGY